MTIQEYKQALDKQGVFYHKNATLEKVTEIYNAHENVVKIAIDEMSGVGKRPIEEMTTTLDRSTGLPITPGGIAIPWSVMATFKPTQWVYSLDKTPSKCMVSKKMYNGVKEDVREYSKEVHGDDFLLLAEGFANKNNSK